MKPYLKIQVEVSDLLNGSDVICQERKIYPSDHALDETYHSFLTYEILEMLSRIRKAMR